jgi:hypothetical protein
VIFPILSQARPIYIPHQNTPGGGASWSWLDLLAIFWMVLGPASAGAILSLLLTLLTRLIKRNSFYGAFEHFGGYMVISFLPGMYIFYKSLDILGISLGLFSTHIFLCFGALIIFWYLVLLAVAKLDN